MPIVTLTSDFGRGDYYLPMIKGAILSQDEKLQLVDITHEIDSYDIVRAAFIFRNAWPSFPKGSIHLISVNDYYQEDCRYLAIQHSGHYFIGPDNGIFTLIFRDEAIKVFELPIPQDKAFPLRDIYSTAIGHIVKEQAFEKIGKAVDDPVQRITFQPVVQPTAIRGAVIHIDRYDNAILNIDRELFDRIGAGRSFQLFFKRHDPITTLSRHYHDVPIGEVLCLFNSAGHLEIAINMGKAAELLGLHVEDTVQLEFKTVNTIDGERSTVDG
ncbi:MAG: SAM-dependent chlorinase/fluorinase [Saprospiraceae bacterium]